MLRSFESADFCHSKAKICTEYGVISKIFNDAVAEICLSKPYGVRTISLYQWEFVGGKAEEGETLEEALIRECREEIGVTVSVGDVFMEVDHVYPDITIHLTLFNAEIAEGEVQILEHNDIKSITPAEIEQYRFCPADDEILKKIKEVF